ncbi:DNA gyrase inhibitor YacG [Terrihabitans sp. B22-R8]|uniref:DNA gyrase inhibitor YacG n=1 Tax=Terrihabitans sp. B22-R8 TaxID=3425128 RepID=UPI00403CC1D9
MAQSAGRCGVSAAEGARPCPICGKPAMPESRPFCSKRCADVDLHRWLGGVYRIETDEAPPDAISTSQKDDK